MSAKLIPEHVDPFRHAEQRLGLDGVVNLQDMQRLSSNIVAGQTGQVAVRLQFSVDEQHINCLKGHLETTVMLQCQRCMEPYSYEIITDFVLGVVNTLDEANSLPEQYEPALARDGELALWDLIEDEIILNLPIIPKHEPDACKIVIPPAEEKAVTEKDASPFKVLESLKQKRH